jgi:hypothetical protein
MIWKQCGRKWPRPTLANYLSTCFEEVRKGSSCSGQDSTRHLPNTSYKGYCLANLSGVCAEDQGEQHTHTHQYLEWDSASCPMGISPAVKGQGREADHSPPSIA